MLALNNIPFSHGYAFQLSSASAFKHIFHIVTKVHENTFVSVQIPPYILLKHTLCSRMFCCSIQEIQMALTPEVSAPYAPKAAIIGLLEKNRNTGLPDVIDKETLSRLGISDSLLDRAFQTLLVLDLIDEDGAQTEALRGLRAAPESEYQTRLAEWLNHAYRDIIQIADPSEGNEISVRDAFRTYSPQSQIDRMVSLFTGLYALAGIWPQVAKAVSKPASTSTKAAPKASPAKRQGKVRNQPPPPPAPTISEKALEYRLVDLMSDAADDQEVMQAIIKVVTYLKTKDAPASAPKAIENQTEE